MREQRVKADIVLFFLQILNSVENSEIGRDKAEKMFQIFEGIQFGEEFEELISDGASLNWPDRSDEDFKELKEKLSELI